MRGRGLGLSLPSARRPPGSNRFQPLGLFLRYLKFSGINQELTVTSAV